MNPAQVLLAVKIGLVGVFLVAAFMLGHRIGAKGVQADWNADKAQRIAAQDKLIADHDRDMTALQAKHDATNVKVSTDHAQAIQDLNDKYNAAIAVSRVNGGLRVPDSICSGSIIAGTQTASDGGNHGDTSGSRELPSDIENNLFSEAKRADEIVEQLRSCQSWIRQNGFYGPVPVQ